MTEQPTIQLLVVDNIFALAVPPLAAKEEEAYTATTLFALAAARSAYKSKHTNVLDEGADEFIDMFLGQLAKVGWLGITSAEAHSLPLAANETLADTILTYEQGFLSPAAYQKLEALFNYVKPADESSSGEGGGGVLRRLFHGLSDTPPPSKPAEDQPPQAKPTPDTGSSDTPPPLKPAEDQPPQAKPTPDTDLLTFWWQHSNTGQSSNNQVFIGTLEAGPMFTVTMFSFDQPIASWQDLFKLPDKPVGISATRSTMSLSMDWYEQNGAGLKNRVGQALPEHVKTITLDLR